MQYLELILLLRQRFPASAEISAFPGILLFFGFLTAGFISFVVNEIFIDVRIKSSINLSSLWKITLMLLSMWLVLFRLLSDHGLFYQQWFLRF